MAARSFTVFQDAPATDAPTTKSATPLVRQTSILGTKLVASNSLVSVNVDDKENLHPVTGERNAASSSKKRKTTVLAVKAIAPVKKEKEKGLKEKVNRDTALEGASPPKKRKSSSSSSTSTKSKLSTKKDSKKDSRSSSSTTRKRPIRKAPSMPKVDEEADPEPTPTQLSQAEIDSLCYDLTVKPLADLSRAYDQGASLDTLVDEEEEESVKLQLTKDIKVEPEAREIFASPPQSAAPPLSTRHTSPAPSSKEPCTFSTPERKKIYAAFTFTSPSPTSKRFSDLNRVTDIPPLEIA